MPAIPDSPLLDKIETARKAGRLPQAHELLEKLLHREQLPAHAALFREFVESSARHYLQVKSPHLAAMLIRRALTWLNLRPSVNEPAWRSRVAKLLVEAGEPARALQELSGPEYAAERAALLVQTADLAVTQGKAGSKHLPADLHAGHQSVVAAFAHYEAGADEAARTALDGIGLKSVFLDWKLLLRGLLAEAAGDTPRALDNWSRLQPARLPGRMAQGLRARLDPEYRRSLPPPDQARIGRQLERLNTTRLLTALRQGGAKLQHENSIVAAIRQLGTLRPEVRKLAPLLEERLSRICYWAILAVGDQRAAQEHRLSFGPLPEDRNYHRLEAIGHEGADLYLEANAHWRKYAAEVAAQAKRWPTGSVGMLHSLIFERMADNLDENLEVEDDHPFPIFDFKERSRRTKPKTSTETPESLLREAAAAAPERLAPLAQLLERLVAEDKHPEAIRLAEQLLARHPDHLPTLKLLFGIALQQQDVAGGLEWFERIRRIDSLDRSLAEAHTRLRLLQAEMLALAGQMDAARAKYAEVLEAARGASRWQVLASWNAAEQKASTPERTAELVSALANDPEAQAGFTLAALRAAACLKVKGPAKKVVDQAFADLLKSPLTAATCFGMLSMLLLWKQEAALYYGQITHTTKAFTYIRSANPKLFSPDQALAFCELLLALNHHRMLADFAQALEQAKPNNLWARYYGFAAQVAAVRKQRTTFYLSENLHRFSKLVESSPSTPRFGELQKRIAALIERLPDSQRFSRFGDFFG